MPFRDNKWIPNPKQATFLSLPSLGVDAIKEGLYGGGNGSGKSEVLLCYPLIRKWYQNPRFKQVFMRRTFPELRKEIVPRSKEFYRPFGAKFNATEMSWKFPREDQYGAGTSPDGATVFLAHCENQDDVHNYDSMEINLFTPDELTSFEEFIYLYIGFTRTRTSDPTLPAVIRAAGMPGDIGHSWVKKRFVTPCPQGGKVIIGKGNIFRIYIHSTLADNPYIDPGYAQSLDALPEAERQARKFGSWDAYLGQVFEEFRERKYPDEPENALHVIKPFEIPDWWPRIVGMDWGYAPPAMTCVIWAAIAPNGRIIIYREQTFQKTEISEWCAQVKVFVDSEDPKVIKLCQSAGQNRGQKHTIHQQVNEELGRNVELSSNQSGSRVAGKMLLHEYFRWKPKFTPEQFKPVYNQSHVEWLLRNGTINDYKKYMKQFDEPESEDNLPVMQIFDTCPKLIEAIKTCVYDKTNPQDVAEFAGDDPYDALRYLADACDRWFNESSNEQKKLQDKEQLLAKFNETGDYNLLFRNAHILGKEKKFVGVSRYHH